MDAIKGLQAQLRLMSALGLALTPLEQVRALFGMGVCLADLLVAGASLVPPTGMNPRQARSLRFSWVRSCLTPEFIREGAIPSREWKRTLLSLGIHPMSLVFASETMDELEFHLGQVAPTGLAGSFRFEEDEHANPFLGSDSPWSLVYEGKGGWLELPERLVLGGRTVVISGWAVHRGLPRHLHCLGPGLTLLDCTGDMVFAPTFRVDGRFIARRCPGLRGLPRGWFLDAHLERCGVSHLPGQSGIHALTLRHCRKLREIGSFPGLTRLELFGCPSLGALPELPSLKSLCLGGVPRPPTLSPMERRLYMVRLESMNGLQEVRSGLPEAEIFWVRDCPKLRSLDGMQRRVGTLRIQGCPRLRELPQGQVAPEVSLSRVPIAALPASLGLRSLHADACPELRDLGVPFDALEGCSISRCPRLPVAQLL